MPHHLDCDTPDFGTPISEWLRQVDCGADGTTVHEVRNDLAKLVGIRFAAAEDGWTPTLIDQDEACERHIRMVLRQSAERKKARLAAQAAWVDCWSLRICNFSTAEAFV